MANGKIPKKPVVWQDIKPASSLVRNSPPKKKNSRITLFIAKIKKPQLIIFFVPEKLCKFGSKFKHLRTKNKILVGLLVFIALVAIGGLIIKTSVIDNRTTSKGVKVEDLATKAPQYQTYLPSGKKISDLGGWQRVSPTDRVAVFAYIDKINDVQINVSQQRLPEEFREDTATQIEQLAKNFKADQKMTVDMIEVYIGTSIKGPQSVIFTKDQTLILIKSVSKINNTSWANYIKNLQ